MSRRTALLATVPVAAVLGAALLAPSSASACPTGASCTDEHGNYELVIPPYSATGSQAGLYDCVWQAQVEFGDGASAFGTFEAEKGLTVSHTFALHRIYLVHFIARNGHHENAPDEACSDVGREFIVFFQTPQEVAEEEQLAKEAREAREAKEKKEAEERAAMEANGRQEQEAREARERAAAEKLGGAGSASGSGPKGISGDGGGQTVPDYWLSCRGRVQVHRVGCAKARKVVGGARRKNLLEVGPQQILGFTCRLTRARPAQISCRRGKARVLAPL
jgi:hypothetical protein